jgi:hypothetical protein
MLSIPAVPASRRPGWTLKPRPRAAGQLHLTEPSRLLYSTPITATNELNLEQFAHIFADRDHRVSRHRCNGGVNCSDRGVCKFGWSSCQKAAEGSLAALIREPAGFISILAHHRLRALRPPHSLFVPSPSFSQPCGTIGAGLIDQSSPARADPLYH